MFFINSVKTKSALGKKIRFEFKVSQKLDSAGILYDLKSYFKCGSVVVDNSKDGIAKFHVTSLKDIVKHVLPHFDLYPCVTSKQLNYLDFKQVAMVKLDNKHNTLEGINAILNIKAGMNKGRTYLAKWNYLISQLPLTLDPH